MIEPSEAAIEAAVEAYHDYRLAHGNYSYTAVEAVLRAALVAAYAVDMPAEGERIATAIVDYRISLQGNGRVDRWNALDEAASIARTPPEETA